MDLREKAFTEARRVCDAFQTLRGRFMSEPRFRMSVIVYIGLILACVLTLLVLQQFRPVGQGASVLVTIPPGSSASAIGRQLLEDGIIRSSDAFAFSVRIRGQGNKLKAGTYDFSPTMSLKEIIKKLTQGAVVNTNIRVTIPEGLTLPQIGMVFEHRGLFTQQEFLSAVKTIQLPYEYLKAVPSDVNYRLEGYLFPDTYEFPTGVTPEQAIRVMAARFNTLIPPRYEQSDIKDKFTLHQLVTMASVVEREAVRNDERPRIAGVFYNRLRQQMRLESCATVQYVIGRSGKLYYADLEVESPYNTYRNAGLPPGPISSAGLLSFEAALKPESTDYLFFVAKPDGSHIFSKTYEQHLQAIKQASR